jgi:hypothetical protein
MMRRSAALVLTLALTAPSAMTPAIAQDSDTLAPSIEHCLRDNAAKVEAAEPDLTKAVDFLVGYICAVPVAQDRARQTAARTRQMAERNQADCEQRAAQRKNTAAPNLVGEDCGRYLRNLNNTVNPLDILSMVGTQFKSPAAAGLAAQLILDLRLAHNKARP